jgi:hypothetical protein
VGEAVVHLGAARLPASSLERPDGFAVPATRSPACGWYFGGRLASRSRAVEVRFSCVIALASAALALLVAAAGADARGVQIRGTAYEFNSAGVVIGGATIRVAEHPRLRATTGPDGSYELTVPDRATVTPYITAPGYHTIFLQTFRTDGQDLRRVNFQTPTEGVYRALAALLDVPLGPDGEPRECAIVSTFNTRNVRDLSFRQFIAYGPHGVPGATAFARPSLPPPIYFNSQVVPDPAQRRSSVDGGVIWPRVPAGVYRIRGRSSSTRFAGFVATCKPGRIVNANPPWGLHQLGKPMPALASARWAVRARSVRLRTMRVVRLPADAIVRVRCRGRRCPFRRRTIASPGGGSLNVRPALGRAARRLRAGQTLEVLVTAHAYNGKLVRWRLRPATRPRAVTLCVPLGNTKPRPRC